MEAKNTVLSLALASILAAFALVSSAAAEGVAQSASGSGHFEFTSEAGATALRTFAFEAHKASAGTVSGQAQLDNRAIPGRVHISIDCVNVIGNIAILSGAVTYSTEAGVSVGDAAIFGAEDNGEGAPASPDRLTIVYENSGLACTDVTPANVGFYTNLLRTVEQGNVQIN
jgi:hypothetical protein